MPTYSKNRIILVRYPFSDLSGSKVRPAVVVNAPHISHDVLIVPLTSKTGNLLSGEFILTDWSKLGLNVETAVKRGVYTILESLVIKQLGELENNDAETLKRALCNWFDLP